LHAGYPGLFVVMALGNIGFPVGTEIVVPFAGALAGSGSLSAVGAIPGWIVVGLVATAAEVVGGTVLYTVGYYGGVPFVKRYGKYIRFREHELDRVHAFYERQGTKTVFLCRFLPFVRGVAALPAGISRMQKRYFITYTAAGSAVFCFGLAYLGETAGKNIDTIVATLHEFSLLAAGIVVLLIVGGIILWRIAKRRAGSGTSA
jgi:membrane protein DedA with SNARE-associated domain